MYFEIKDGRIFFYKVDVNFEKLDDLKRKITLDLGKRIKIHKEELEDYQVYQERNQNNALVLDFKENLTEEKEEWLGSHTGWTKIYTVDYTRVEYPKIAIIIETFERAKCKNLFQLINLLDEETSEKTNSYINEIYSCISLKEIESLEYEQENFYTYLINSGDGNLSKAASYINSHNLINLENKRIRRL